MTGAVWREGRGRPGEGVRPGEDACQLPDAVADGLDVGVASRTQAMRVAVERGQCLVHVFPSRGRRSFMITAPPAAG